MSTVESFLKEGSGLGEGGVCLLPDIDVSVFARHIGGSVRRNNVRCRLAVCPGCEQNTTVRTKYQKWSGGGQKNI